MRGLASSARRHSERRPREAQPRVPACGQMRNLESSRQKGRSIGRFRDSSTPRPDGRSARNDKVRLTGEAPGRRAGLDRRRKRNDRSSAAVDADAAELVLAGHVGPEEHLRARRVHRPDGSGCCPQRQAASEQSKPHFTFPATALATVSSTGFTASTESDGTRSMITRRLVPALNAMPTWRCVPGRGSHQ